MNRIGLVAVISALLCGCATGMMEKGLGALVGKDVQTAFKVLGYPSDKQEVGGETVYFWLLTRFETYAAPRTSTAYGSVGNAPALGTITNIQTERRRDSCLVKMITASNGQIISSEYEGNSSACSRFAGQLGEYYNQQNSR